MAALEADLARRCGWASCLVRLHGGGAVTPSRPRVTPGASAWASAPRGSHRPELRAGRQQRGWDRPGLAGPGDMWEEPAGAVGMRSAGKRELCQGLAGRAAAGGPEGREPVGGSRTQEVSEGNTPSPGAARQSRVGQTSQLLMSCFEYFIRRRRGEAESAGGSDGGLTRRSWTSNYPGQRSL